MINIKIEIKKPSFKFQLFKKDLQKYYIGVVYEAARAFVRAATAATPVRTGMARGSFLPVSKKLDLAVPYPSYFKNDKYYNQPFYGQVKTPQLGGLLTTFHLPDKSADVEDMKFEITLGTAYYGKKNKEWQAIQKGESAYKKVLLDATNVKRGVFGFVKKPQLKDYIVTTEIN